MGSGQLRNDQFEQAIKQRMQLDKGLGSQLYLFVLAMMKFFVVAWDNSFVDFRGAP